MPKATCPAILVAAPASGQGKTTMACALARLYTRQGLSVRVFKCGPDFLDPYWLELASGAPVYQLDLWMTGESDCAQRLHDAAQIADLIIVEGVMGLYDGDPSAADLAQRFGLHVLAVIDAGAMAGTFGALAHGLQTYRDGLQFAGVLANRVASVGHAEMLKVSLRDPQQWQGALMRNEALTLPERHLGLVMATELSDAMARLDVAADALASIPLGQKSANDLKSWEVVFDAPESKAASVKLSKFPKFLDGKTIAVAKDAAFCFIYTANIDCLRQLGANIAYFSPLKDAELPVCDALWLPGGYPELHTQALVSNLTMVSSIRQHVQSDKPVWAECGGMMALFDSIETVDGVVHAMWGLIPGRIAMQKRLAALGPQQLNAFTASSEHLEPLRGHTFHYSICTTDMKPTTRTLAAPGKSLWASNGNGEALYQAGSIRASYFHAWFASSPTAAARLFLKDSA